VVVVDTIDERALRELRECYDVTVRLRPSQPELLQLVADAEVIVLRSGVRITADVIRAAPALKLIARAGSGLDNIDLAAARAADVQVFNVPGQSANAVAELAIGLLLASARHIALGDARLRRGTAEKASLIGSELRERTLGMIGLGAIGSRIAHLAGAFEMRVVGCVARPTAERRRRLAERGIELVELAELLRRANFVCVAVPLTTATRALIGKSELRAMKPEAHLVNVSRAGVIDEDALAWALASGAIAGAALDVPADERDASYLRAVDQVVLTPHIGAMTTDAQRRIGDLLTAAIAVGLRGEPVATRVC
jgi:D-3-phosphoglycerate dehydrogenase